MEMFLQDAIHNLQELTASVKEYQRECGIQSFDMPDESAEIKKEKKRHSLRNWNGIKQPAENLSMYLMKK